MRPKTIYNQMRQAVLAAVILCAVLPGAHAQPPPPQILTLPNGLKYQFAGVTLDTKNVPPSLEADLVNALPKPLEKLARQYAGTKITQFNADEKFATPHLFVWFHRLGTNAPESSINPPLTARLTDQNGVAAGVAATSAFATSVAWSYAEFPVFPRRSRVIQCDLYPFGGGNPAVPVGHIQGDKDLYSGVVGVPSKCVGALFVEASEYGLRLHWKPFNVGEKQLFSPFSCPPAAEPPTDSQ